MGPSRGLWASWAVRSGETAPFVPQLVSGNLTPLDRPDPACTPTGLELRGNLMAPTRAHC